MTGMASDTSLVFNLVARDRASAELNRMRGKFEAASAAIGAGVAAALGVGVAANLDMEAASDKLAAQLGVGPAEAAELSKVSAKVYQGAWGESTAEVNDAIRGVYQNVGNTDVAGGGVERLTTKTLALAEAFDQDVNMATAAVGQMMKTGMAKNADEAFDIITRGFQSGVNKSDDFLETLNEYGTQFRKLGLDGATATGILSQGLKAGARDADLVADAVKEFSIRAIDGSKGTAEGFSAIGLSAGDMSKRIGAGGKTASDALDETLDRLRAMEDPVARDAAAVALFGTQAEDLGASLFALDPSKAVASLGKVKGAAEDMSNTLADNPAAALEEFKRKAVGKLAEISGTFVKFAMDNRAVFEPLAMALTAVAGAILVAKAAMIAHNVVTAISTGLTAANSAAVAGNSLALAVYGVRVAAVRTATAIWTGIQWALNTALLANPIGIIVLAVVALIAIIVLVATKTKFFQTIWNAAWAKMKAIFSAVWNWMKTTFNALVTFFTSTIPNAANTVKNRVVAAWNTIKAGLGAAWAWIRNSVLNPVKTFFTVTIPNAAAALKARVVGAWNTLKAGLGTAWSGLKSSVLNPIKTFFTSTIPNAANTVKNRVIGAWNSLKSGVQNKASAMKNFVTGKLNALISFVTGMPGRITSAASGMFNGIKNAFRSAINFVIRGWNRLSFSVGLPVIPDWVPGVGGKGGGRVTVGTPNIPFLAKGGIATAAGMAMVGERGPEMLSLPKGAQVNPLPLSGGGGGSHVTIEFKKSGNALMDKLLEELQDSIRVRGGNVQTVLGYS